MAPGGKIQQKRGVAQFGRALGWGPRGFAGSSPVTPTESAPLAEDFKLPAELRQRRTKNAKF